MADDDRTAILALSKKDLGRTLMLIIGFLAFLGSFEVGLSVQGLVALREEEEIVSIVVNGLLSIYFARIVFSMSQRFSSLVGDAIDIYVAKLMAVIALGNTIFCWMLAIISLVV